MTPEALREKILLVHRLTPAWIEHGGDPDIITDTMKQFLTLASQHDLKHANDVLDQLVMQLRTVPSKSGKTKSDTTASQVHP
ncbi:MAG: hypothetical protein NDI90_03255 [Nitrospira sp. BO4]|jgi:hypothetical protein|nr:hypothetical protein [Nitrospira sp. BO4]